MRFLCAALCMSISFSAWGDSIARQGSDWIRLTLKPCEGRAAEAVTKMGQDPLSFRAGYASIGGQEFGACWMPANGGAAIIYSDGDAGFVPMDALKPAPEA